MAKPITIGNRTFPTQKAAKELFKDLWQHYANDCPGEDFIEWEDVDKEMMLSFMSYSDKFKRGHTEWDVGQQRCRGGWRPAVRLGKYILFFGFQATWDKMTMPKEKVDKKHWDRVLRSTIQPHIAAMKSSWFIATEVKCCISGEELYRDNCHADHYGENTFSVIVEKFTQYLNDNDLELNDLRTERLPHGENILIEPDATVWKDFHNELADIRPTLNTANMSKGNRNDA